MNFLSAMRKNSATRPEATPDRRARALARRTVGGSLLGAAILTAAACGSSGGSGGSSGTGGSLESLNFGIAVATPTSATQYVALDEGDFAKHGLDVHFVSFNGGSPSLSATSSGNPPVARENAFATLGAILKGYPIKVVEENSSALPGDFVINAAEAKSHGISKTTNVKQFLQDIKGMTIGNQAPGDTFQLILSGLLKQNSLPDSWITRNDLREAPQVLEALQHGDIDGAFTDAPAPQQAEEGGYGQVIFSTGDISDAFNTVVDGIVVANSSWAKTHQKELSELAAAFTDANKSILANPTKAAQLLHDKQFNTISVPLLADTLKSELVTSSVAVNKDDWNEVGTLSNKYGLETFNVTPQLLTKALNG